MVEVALFPIPNSVNFPGVPCALHVFEPRYRQMVRHCVETGMLMGICHTEKVLHDGSEAQSMSEALNSNQATYKPCRVFSAGAVSLLQELEDGRLLIEVDTSLRVRLKTEKQTLPFSIWSCEELLDEGCDAASDVLLAQAQEKILQRLIVLTHDNEKAQAELKSAHWQDMPAHKFSFVIAGLLGMPSEMSQRLLEMTNPQERLDDVLGMINEIGADIGG